MNQDQAVPDSAENELTEDFATQPDTTQAGEGESKEASAVEDKDKSSKSPEWAERRFAKLTSQKYEYKARAEHAERIAQELERRLQGGTEQAENEAAPRQPLDEKEIYRRAQAKATFDLKCNAVWKDGVKEFGDEFKHAVSKLQHVADLDESQLAVIVDGDHPHKVLHYLSQNPDEAAEILDLPPMQLARRLARLEAKLDSDDSSASTNKPVSKAPPPPTPVKGKATVSDLPKDTDDMATWIRKENERMRKARAR